MKNNLVDVRLDGWAIGGLKALLTQAPIDKGSSSCCDVKAYLFAQTLSEIDRCLMKAGNREVQS